MLSYNSTLKEIFVLTHWAWVLDKIVFPSSWTTWPQVSNIWLKLLVYSWCFNIISLFFWQSHGCFSLSKLKKNLKTFLLTFCEASTLVMATRHGATSLLLYYWYWFTNITKIFKFMAQIHAKRGLPPLSIWKSYLLQPLVDIYSF